MRISALFAFPLFFAAALCSAPLRIGSASPDFTLMNEEDVPVELKDLKGKPILLLIANNDDLSKKTLSHIAELHDYYAESELVIIPVANGLATLEAIDLKEELWLTYPLFGDIHGSIAGAFGIDNFPGVVILDNDHKVRHAEDYSFDLKKMHAHLKQSMRQKVFFVTAKRYEYNPSVLRVSKGDNVLIKMISEDVEHGMYIDGYQKYVKRLLDRDGNRIEPRNAEQHIKPGELGIVAFTADKGGRFSLRCASTCGEFHPYMIGHLRVSPNPLFPGGIAIVLLIAVLAILSMALRKGVISDKFLGILPFSWRFELTQFKIVRSLFKNRWFPLIVILVNLSVFTVVLVSAYTGGFHGAGNFNFGVMMVWILWWVLLMFLLVPGFSRSWCMMCPFPLFSDWFQRRSLLCVSSGKPWGIGRRWPKRFKNMWIMNFAFLATTFFSGFFTVRPMATFILLGGIILLAFGIGLIFEKRTFCLYLCPVSGFQGLYAQFAASEIRRKDPAICKKHLRKTCFTGNEQGYGCPWTLAPFNFEKNTYCGMCLECFKTCPHDNMALNIRTPGVDLLVDTKREPRRLDEAWKAFIMLAIAMVFYLAFQGPWGGIKDMVRGVTPGGYLSYIGSHMFFSLVAIPAFFFVFTALSKLASGAKLVSQKKIFTDFAYTLIPLGLGVWIAFSIGIILPNGSYLFHVISDPFAWGWNLLGTANFPWTPVFTRYVGILQGATIILFYLCAIAYGRRISVQLYGQTNIATRGWFPIQAFLALITLVFMWLFLG